MGKGGTKFEGEAIGVRSGRQKRGPSFKDMKKEMEAYQKTGRHPALEQGQTHVLPSLPVRDPNRPHVFLSFGSGKTDLGRILVEVFEPELPITCKNFLNRCNPGAQNTFKGTKVDRVVENYALFGGVSKGNRGAQQRRNDYLKHVQSGLVSVTLNGDALAVTLDRALTLDDTHQVVGRVHGEASMKVIERLNTTAVGTNDEPISSLRISDCGQTDSDGNYDPLLAGSRRKETAKQAAARLKAEEASARSAVGSALQAGLAQEKKKATRPVARIVCAKRKVPEEMSEPEDNNDEDEDDWEEWQRAKSGFKAAKNFPDAFW